MRKVRFSWDTSFHPISYCSKWETGLNSQIWSLGENSWSWKSPYLTEGHNLKKREREVTTMENQVLICIHLEKDGLRYLNIWQWKRGLGMLPMMCLTEATWDLQLSNCTGSSWWFNFTESNKTNKNRLDRGWTWLCVAPQPQKHTCCEGAEGPSDCLTLRGAAGEAEHGLQIQILRVRALVGEWCDLGIMRCLPASVTLSVEWGWSTLRSELMLS